MITHELLDSPVYTLILPDVGMQTLREAREQQPPECQTYCQDCSQKGVFRKQNNKSGLKVKIND